MDWHTDWSAQLADVEFGYRVDVLDTAAWKWAACLDTFCHWWSSATMPAAVLAPGTLRSWERWLSAPTWGERLSPQELGEEEQWVQDRAALLQLTREAREAIDAAWPCQYPYPVLHRTGAALQRVETTIRRGEP